MQIQCRLWGKTKVNQVKAILKINCHRSSSGEGVDEEQEEEN